MQPTLRGILELPVVQAGGGLLVPDDEMSPDWVAREVPALLGDPARLAQISRGAFCSWVNVGRTTL